MRIHQERDARTSTLLAALAGDIDLDSPEGHHLVEQVFVLHLDLCDALARRYFNRGIERDDLLQVARLGLLKAIRRYSPEEGKNFAGFAVPTITGELKRHFRDLGWVVRPSRRVQELRFSLRQTREVMTHELQRAPTRAELATCLGVAVTDVSHADEADSSFRPASIDQPSSTAEHNPLTDAVCVSDRALEAVCDHVDLRRALEGLSSEARRVLQLRFVEDRSQRDIADEIGATQMQVSRMLGRILRQLRSELEEASTIAS
ncbi:sigma-70 family RNA polymerase sigma factor [Humibacillus xanthopallidus]|nr:sigma-70 family RNA polymerase sigma factor [Humibacillus xanthopallidus]